MENNLVEMEQPKRKFLDKKTLKNSIVKTLGEPVLIPSMDVYVNIKKWNGLERNVLATKIQNNFNGEDLLKLIKIEDQIENQAAKVDVGESDINKMFNMFVDTLILSLVDEDANPIFTYDDVDLFKDFEFAELQMLFQISTDRNGFAGNSVAEELKN